MTKPEILQKLLDPGVIAIIRSDHPISLSDAIRALVEGGIVVVEITMTTPGAIQLIQEAAEVFGERIVVGVGSVLDRETAQLAIEAGANFVVTPVLRPSVVNLCRRLEKPVMSGAYTPTEAVAAWEAGSDYIKIFPAGGLGPDYIKAIRAPLPQLGFIPTGGVDLNNCGEFIRAGCVAVAAGSSLASKEILELRDWQTLTKRASELVVAVKAAKARS